MARYIFLTPDSPSAMQSNPMNSAVVEMVRFHPTGEDFYAWMAVAEVSRDAVRACMSKEDS